jgi:hypothetical protein
MIWLTISLLVRLSNNWNAPIYAFYEPLVKVEYVRVKGVLQKCHTFKCALKRCRNKGIHQFLAGSDRQSTSNLRKHAKRCWGDDTIENADKLPDVAAARSLMDGVTQSSITKAFAWVVNTKVSYATRQHSKGQVR